MKYISAILFFLTVFLPISSQTIDKIVNDFISANEVQYENIGMGSQKSPLYQSFLSLKKIATNDELLQLTQHQNPIVRCYAGWALIDKKYSNLESLFENFVNNDATVLTFNIDIKNDDKISSEFYHRYWNSIDNKNKSTNPQLFKLDSIVLFNPKSDWLLVQRSLENRISPRRFNKRIEFLAFENHNIDALLYLSNWYKAEYVKKLKTGFVDYLLKTDFKKEGVSRYYSAISELLKYHDEGIERTVLNKLRQDRRWELDKTRFVDLLHDNMIYESDLQ